MSIDAFHELHRQGCFVLPNPWDVGSARMFEAQGYRALATTSAGLAFSRGQPDTPGGLPLEIVLDNVRAIVEGTSLPVQADFQDGYADSLDGVRDNVRRCVNTGVAGLSIEDAATDQPLYPLAVAVRRIEAARRAIDESGTKVVLTGRAESFLTNHPRPLQDVLERLTAYRAAGADCLYAPGLRTPEQVQAVLDVADGLPVNVLAADPQWMSVDTLRALGVRRISVGSAFARIAWAAVRDAASQVLARGRFDALERAAPFSELKALWADAAAPQDAKTTAQTDILEP